MMVRLLPAQVGKIWPMLESAIAASLPSAIAQSDDSMKNILSNLMIGKLDCWTLYERDEKAEINLQAIATTAVWIDEVSGNRNLLLYSFYSFNGQLSDEKWLEALNVLFKWAVNERCNYIVAYSTIPKIVNFAKRLGADVSTTFIMFPAMASPTSNYLT